MKRHAIEKALEITKRAINEDKLYAQHWHNAIAASCWDAIEDAELEINNSSEGINSYAVANDAASRFMKLYLGVDAK